MKTRERATFDANELAVVLSHYELGIIESITEFPRGSRHSPKVGIVSQSGKFLLKRRPAARARPEKTRFAHEVQEHLIRAGFPVPKLLARRDAGKGALQIRDFVYELFEFIPGHPFGRTSQEAYEAGGLLARFHEATNGFLETTDLVAPRGDYHDIPGVRTGLCGIGSTLSSHDSFSGDEAELAGLIQQLLGDYDRAAEAVNVVGLTSWPERIIHSDWHPGNLLFRNHKVVAVIDYDTLRVSRRVIDVGNGALQFSMLASGDPETWPDELDEARFEAFLAGYDQVDPLGREERICLPHLMIEALIAECVPPITQTGSVGRWAGYRVLRMARRKVDWIDANAKRLATVRET